MPDRVHGAALFADISGFTPLTEALASELGPQRGAEELTAHLGRVFHAVIEELDAAAATSSTSRATRSRAGSMATTGSRATAAALAMQEAMAREGTIDHAGRRDGPAGAQGRGRDRTGAALRRRRSRRSS